jgi:hypothetical protein
MKSPTYLTIQSVNRDISAVPTERGLVALAMVDLFFVGTIYFTRVHSRKHALVATFLLSLLAIMSCVARMVRGLVPPMEYTLAVERAP